MSKIIKAQKRQLRHDAKASRDALDEDLREEFSGKICANLLSFISQWTEGNPNNRLVIASYAAFNSEVDLSSFHSEILERGHRLLLPRVDTLTHSINFIEVTSLQPDSFQKSPYGIDEPIGPVIPTTLHIDVLLLPGLLFDATRARLGYGGGFYDRFAAERATLQEVAPVYIGIAFSQQIVGALPVEPHDLHADHIVTENGFDAD